MFSIKLRSIYSSVDYYNETKTVMHTSALPLKGQPQVLSSAVAEYTKLQDLLYDHKSAKTFEALYIAKAQEVYMKYLILIRSDVITYFVLY